MKSATRDRKLSSSIKKRINADVDTTAIDKEIKTYKTQMRKLYGCKDVINNDIEALDVEDKHYLRRKRDLEEGLYKIYDRIDEVVSFLNGFTNLFCVGRNGQHRYNNIDHSMMTSFLTVDSILEGKTDKRDIWNVNTEKEYHENKK